MKLKIIGLFTLLCPTLSYAFFCPNNFNQINVGDTIEQVTQACGNPDVKDEKEVKPEGPQEWNYFVPQTVALDAMHQTQGTLKTTFVFDTNGKIINMTVNGIGVGASTVCGNNLQLGDTRDMVKKTCGDPTFINKQTNGPEKESVKVVEFSYNASPGTKLIFENGKLKERK